MRIVLTRGGLRCSKHPGNARERCSPPPRTGQVRAERVNHTELPACKGERVIAWTTVHPRKTPNMENMGPKTREGQNRTAREGNERKQTQKKGPNKRPRGQTRRGQADTGPDPTRNRTETNRTGTRPETARTGPRPTRQNKGRNQTPGRNHGEPTSVHQGSPRH